MVEGFFFIGNRTGKTNSPIKLSDGSTLLDFIFKNSYGASSIIETDNRGDLSGVKRTFQ